MFLHVNITFRYRKRDEKRDPPIKNYSFPRFERLVFLINKSNTEENFSALEKWIIGRLPPLETFHSLEDAIYNDLPLIASDAGVRLRDWRRLGAQPRKKDSPFEAKHRCSRKSIKRPAPVCIEFEREIRVRTLPNPGRVDFICRSFSAYLYFVYVLCICVALLTCCNIDQPSSVTRDPRHQLSRGLVGKHNCYDLFIHRGDRRPDDPINFSFSRILNVSLHPTG